MWEFSENLNVNLSTISVSWWGLFSLHCLVCNIPRWIKILVTSKIPKVKSKLGIKFRRLKKMYKQQRELITLRKLRLKDLWLQFGVEKIHVLPGGWKLLCRLVNLLRYSNIDSDIQAINKKDALKDLCIMHGNNMQLIV